MSSSSSHIILSVSRVFFLSLGGALVGLLNPKVHLFASISTSQSTLYWKDLYLDQMEGNKEANPSFGDVISTLPDDILCQVLAFLTTKEVALTRVLSKRWSNLLQLLPILDFDDSLIQNQQQMRVFMDFVDSVLSLRVKNNPSLLKKVTLSLSRVTEGDCVERWIRTVIDLGALELSLRFDYLISYVQFDVFTSKDLVKLRIGSRIILYEATTQSVSPMLKSLVLDSVGFEELYQILTPFPSLQTLRILESDDWYYWDGCVSSPTLKKFVYRRDDNSSGPKPCVTFNTPELVYLDYSDVVADKYENLHLDNLVEVRLDLQTILRNDPDHVVFFPGYASTLFMAIRNVKILCLSPDALVALCYRCERIPVFNNLICLSLGSDRTHCGPCIFWKMLESLLLNSKNLQTLVIKGLVHYVQDVECCVRNSWWEYLSGLSSSGVKVLQITGYEGTGLELCHMKRFLGKLSHLEMVRVTHKAVDDGERCRLMNDLLGFHKASSKCKVQFMEESV